MMRSLESADKRLRPTCKSGVHLPQACERDAEAVPGQLWLAENQCAVQEWNDYVAKHGLPLAAYRQF